MIIHEIKQGTDEWLRLKAGKFSGSRFEKLFMGKSTQGYNDEILRVVYGRLTGEYPETYQSKYMQDGIELEPIARRKYEMETFEDVIETGFIEYNDYIGVSLDGMVNDNKTIEIKCPKYNTMIKYLLNPEYAYNEYKYQVQGGLWVTERECCDMMLYHPKLPHIILPKFRDEKIIKELETETEIAIKKVED